MALSDGIFAVAMTLLVLDLRVPVSEVIQSQQPLWVSGAVQSEQVLWDALVQALQHPAAGGPHRPTELEVRPDERWEALRLHIEEIGVGGKR